MSYSNILAGTIVLIIALVRKWYGDNWLTVAYYRQLQQHTGLYVCGKSLRGKKGVGCINGEFPYTLASGSSASLQKMGDNRQSLRC